MRTLITKLVNVEKELAIEHGEFSFFILALREDSVDRWDLLVSAPWLGKMDTYSLEIVVGKLQLHLSTKEIVFISRVVIIEESKQIPVEIQDFVTTEQGITEVRDVLIYGVQISRAYVISSQKNIPVLHATYI
jgi:hypothetical protein